MQEGIRDSHSSKEAQQHQVSSWTQTAMSNARTKRRGQSTEQRCLCSVLVRSVIKAPCDADRLRTQVPDDRQSNVMCRIPQQTGQLAQSLQAHIDSFWAHCALLGPYEGSNLDSRRGFKFTIPSNGDKSIYTDCSQSQ